MSGVLSIFNAKVDVLSYTESDDAHGRPKRVWYVGVTAVPCYMEQKTTTETVQAGGEREMRMGIAQFEPTQTILNTDRLRWGTRILEVQAVNPISDDPDLTSHIRVEWQEVTGAH